MPFCARVFSDIMLSPPNTPSPPPDARISGTVGLKKSARPLRWVSVVALTSHINRKKAIIAVTKSA
jgi:hypothetical protein